MNSFDAVVGLLGLVVAVVTGFKAGLLRSAVTILAGRSPAAMADRFAAAAAIVGGGANGL